MPVNRMGGMLGGPSSVTAVTISDMAGNEAKAGGPMPTITAKTTNRTIARQIWVRLGIIRFPPVSMDSHEPFYHNSLAISICAHLR